MGCVGAQAQQALEPAAEFGRRDLPCIVFADGGQMRRVDDATLEEGQLVVEFEAIDVEGGFGRADPAQRLLREQALIGEVVDGQDARDPDRVPGEIGRHQRGLPVIGVHQVRCPIPVQCACRQLGSGRGKASEAHVIVGPVPTRCVAIGIARAVIEFRTEQDVDRQPVPGCRQSERAGRHLRQRGTLTDDLDVQELFDHVPVAGKDDPDVAERA